MSKKKKESLQDMKLRVGQKFEEIGSLNYKISSIRRSIDKLFTEIYKQYGEKGLKEVLYYYE